ncbi:hypothetical protein HELRODRAFT_170854 [Helobdella robusta]|uniref:Enoyl-[acyl-carrier-protein] reductase, mitochondrial n=1 Tax=Helobdella robusta TaxID=6412 RepID=T1F3I5_HELRO|nr:hypothetical protein HELRODRAFT_170854 [Helobdella robusta]ESO06833.1 hypothetical protein HELRODRAFT_170854 [Helobdella robusta]
MQLRVTNLLVGSCRSFKVYHSTYSSKVSQKCSSLIYQSNGDPEKVVELIESTLSKPSKSEVMVRMLAATINPADMNMIQGIYPIKPPLPAVGGNEGVGEILMVGSDVKDFQVGDRVLSIIPGWGTWRTHANSRADQFIKISKDLPVVSAATLSVNPCTAYRMLKDFVKLEKGDVIIQNGANSAVGQAVIQIAAELQVRTINIVRNRPDLSKLVDHLNSLGATHVLTDDLLRSPEVKEILEDLPKPKLGLNTVGGKSAADLLKHMEAGSTLVTYGGMSKQPLMVPTGLLIFNDVKLSGFWMSRWTAENMRSQEQRNMIQWLTDLVMAGKLKPPKHEVISFSEFKMGIHKTMQPFTGKKQILLMNGLDGSAVDPSSEKSDPPKT